MAGGLKMAWHRATHNSNANEPNINHLIRLSILWLCVDHLFRVPPKAFNGGFPRLVFAPNPAAVSNLIKISKQKGIVDLAGPGFVATRIISDLNLCDTSEVLLQRWRHVTFHQLHVGN